MARGNVIEIVAQWRDQGVSAGLKQTTQSMTVLTNAIGTAAGIGAIASVQNLSRALGQLVRAPFDAANAMAKLTEQVKAGIAVSDEARESYANMARVVGEDGVRAFNALAIASHQAETAMEAAKVQAAAAIAPISTIWNMNTALALTSGIGFAPGGGAYLRPPAARPAPLVGGIEVSSQRFIGPREGTPAERAYAQMVQDATAAARELAASIRDVRGLALFLAQQPGTATGFAQPRLPGPTGDLETQIYGSAGIKGERRDPKKAKDLESEFTNAALSISAAMTSAVTSFVTGIQTMGQAALAFVQQLAATIISTLADIGAKFALSGLLGGIGSLIGGPIGGFLGGVAGKILPFSAGAPRGGMAAAGGGGNTYIFQGINTRDAYMSFQRGELGRAQDLQRLRAEVS